jgi:hypothetical protein
MELAERAILGMWLFELSLKMPIGIVDVGCWWFVITDGLDLNEGLFGVVFVPGQDGERNRCRSHGLGNVTARS